MRAAPPGQVSPKLYGLMTEEINHSYDGGLYAELIQNRAFLDDANAPVHWSVVNDDGVRRNHRARSGQIRFNDKLTTSLRLTVTKATKDHPAGVANNGYWGIPVQPKTPLSRFVSCAGPKPIFPGRSRFPS